MFKHHLKIGWRNLLKNKQQTLINLMGLTIGTVSCLAITIYVLDQFGYDEHHENAELIYRVETSIERSGEDVEKTSFTSPPIVFTMKEDFPEVVQATRIVITDKTFNHPIRSEEDGEGYYENNAYLADYTFFNVFSYKLIEGVGNSALKEPFSIVLSSSLKKKLFGSQSALGKSVIWGTGKYAQNLNVKGVFDDTLFKSHLNPTYIISMNTPGLGNFINTASNFATQNMVYGYVKLVPGVNTYQLQNKFSEFMKLHGSNDMANAGILNKVLSLKKIKDIYLYSSGVKDQIGKVSNIKYLYFLLTLAFFIQLIACVNFINLSTARAGKRAKEIGIRKVAGASKRIIEMQFLAESLLLSFFVMLISLPITLALIPTINEITGGNLVFSDLFNWQSVVILTGLGIITGFLAGGYPAIVISSFKPINVLRGIINPQSSFMTVQKGLVLFQLVVSIALVIVVLIVSQQGNYFLRKNLGFEKENLIGFRVESDVNTSKFNALKNEFGNIPEVISIASSRYAPSEIILTASEMFMYGDSQTNSTVVKKNGVSRDYFRTMQIPLLQGRDFRENDDKYKVIVNEATLRKFNIKKELAQNTKLLQQNGDEIIEHEIVGVIKDFHFASLKEEIEPLLLYYSYEPNWLLVRTDTQNFSGLLSKLRKSWNDANYDAPFAYAFVDKQIGELYVEEQSLRKIFFLFTIIAISISCFGLFGLVSYIAEQKKKEIGIRKVLGASVNSIVQLLTQDFVKLVLVAFLIASPVSYYFINRWLEGYTYRIQISWWIFLAAGGLTLIITILTVGFQSLKAGILNPSKTLRTE